MQGRRFWYSSVLVGVSHLHHSRSHIKTNHKVFSDLKRSRWEVRVHVVVSRKKDDSPVYEVKQEAGSGGSRILHRNLLFPCNYLPIDIPSKSSQKRAGRV